MMTFNEKLRKAHAEWALDQDFELFGTLKFLDGHSVHSDVAKKRLRYFFNMLDRKVRGAKAIEAGNRITRFVYLETGRSRDNTHAHFLIKGSTLEETKDIIRHTYELWSKVDMSADAQYELIEDNKGISHYCVKEQDTRGSEILFTDCTHI